jgi:tetratricopeptide (TPR) repeat protein
MAGNTDAARALLAEALGMDTDLVITHLNLGLLALRETEYAAAIGHFEDAIDRGGPSPDLEGLLGHAAAKNGQTERAQAILERLAAWESERYVAPIGPALVHLGLGDTDAAIASLEAAVGDRNWHVVMLEHHFLFDPLRGEAAFEVLVDTVGRQQPDGATP